MDESVTRGQLEATTLALLEELCQRMKLTLGHTRIEVEYVEGVFQVAYRHERVNLVRLGEAYEPSRDQSE